MGNAINLFVLVALLGSMLSGTAQIRHRYSTGPQVTNIFEGISWPKGQALPIFATPAAAMDGIEVQALTPDEQVTFSALQGQVNRTKPRIYLIDVRSDEGRETWAQTPTLGLNLAKLYTRETKFDLLAKYTNEVKGLVLYDPFLSPHYRNLAGTIAGLRRALPVTREIRERLQEHGIVLPVLVDLTELKYSSPIEIYEHLYEKYWAQCEKRLIVSARPTQRGDFHHTRDIAAACGAAVVWLDNRIPAERAVMRKFFADMKAGEAVALGWYSSERSGITTASEFGIGTLPADFYLNGSVYSGTDHHIDIPGVPKMPALTNKVYIAVLISDGDNIQYAQHAMRRIWDRAASDRGKVPLNWTISPGLVDIGPGLLNYYYATATSNDCFVCGPSGLGYIMPYNTLTEPGASVGTYTEDPRRMDGYTRLTESYLRRSGLKAVTIWDDATPMQRASYAENCRSLYGATVQNFKDVPSVRPSVEDHRMRFEKMVIPYATTYAHIRSSLAREIRNWEGAAPAFLCYQVSIWGEMKPARIVELQEDLGRTFTNRAQFVRADHYFTLYNQANGLPFNLVLRPKTSVKTGNSRSGLEPDAGTARSNGSRTAIQWTKFDFGGVYEISRYVIRYACTNGTGHDFGPAQVTAQAQTDNGKWTTVDVFKAGNSEVTDVELEPVKARFFRITEENASAASAPALSAVEIFGKKVEPPLN